MRRSTAERVAPQWRDGSRSPLARRGAARRGRVHPLPGAARRLRPLHGDARSASRRDHLRRRGLERVGGRVAAAERRAQLPQRRQGAGVERAAGHAPAADARPPHDARARRSRSGARHRLRRRRDGRRGRRSIRVVEHETIAEIEPLVPQRRLRPTSASTTSTSSEPKVHVQIDDARHFVRDDEARSSTPSRRIRSIRG